MRRRAYAVLLVGAFFGLVPVPASAGPEQKHICSVWVEQQGDDAIGNRLDLAVKERIRTSPLYRLADRKESRFFSIYLIGVELHDGRSAVGVTYVVKEPTGKAPSSDWSISTAVTALSPTQVVLSADRILAGLEKAGGPYREACD